jgi:enamine deaminase RidA (YjgF/YER057c/UK114 family)
MVESAGSSLEQVVRVHVVLADISHMAEWIAYSANSSQSIRPARTAWSI